MSKDFTKDFFQKVWGENGYFEEFSYGVGYKEVIATCIKHFINPFHYALEIGSGGGTFTRHLMGKFKHTTAVDVIKKPRHFEESERFKFIELPDQSTDLPGIENNSIDFCFSYNVFCHLSNEMIKEYLKSVYRVLKPNGNFVFMLAKYEETKKHFKDDYNLGELTPIGHFAQDDRTIDLVTGEGWKIVNRNMIPEHRDIIVHLKNI